MSYQIHAMHSTVTQQQQQQRLKAMRLFGELMNLVLARRIGSFFSPLEPYSGTNRITTNI